MRFETNSEHKYTWSRELGDGRYEMWMVIQHHHSGEGPSDWYAGGGTFSLDDYDEKERRWAIESHALDHMVREPTDYEVAQALFENCFADFPLESFDAEHKAFDYIRAMTRGC